MKAKDCKREGTIYLHGESLFFIAKETINDDKIRIIYADKVDDGFSRLCVGYMYLNETHIKAVLQKIH